MGKDEDPMPRNTLQLPELKAYPCLAIYQGPTRSPRLYLSGNYHPYLAISHLPPLPPRPTPTEHYIATTRISRLPRNKKTCSITTSKTKKDQKPMQSVYSFRLQVGPPALNSPYCNHKDPMPRNKRLTAPPARPRKQRRVYTPSDYR